MKAIFRKTNNGFSPDSDEAAALFAKVPTDSYAIVEYIKTRNYRNLKRFFALVNVTFELQDCFTNKEIWRKHLIMLGGHYDEVIISNPKTGETSVQYWPKSIDFESMEETEFQELFSKIVTAYIDRFGNGLTEDKLLRVIEFD